MKVCRVQFIVAILLFIHSFKAGAQKHVFTDDLQLSHVSSSKTATLEVCDQFYKGLPLIDAHVYKWSLIGGDSLIVDTRKHWNSILEFQQATHWFYDSLQHSLIGCKMTQEIASNGIEQWVCRDSYGQIRWQEDVKRYYSDPDTSVLINVFYPNPVVSQKLSYGVNIWDQSDHNSPRLQEALRTQSIKLLRNDKGILASSEFFSFDDLSAPVTNAPILKSDSVLLDRSHPDFEYFNILFHLQNFSSMVEAAGYKALIGELVIDHNALNGKDQSAFNPFHSPHSLEFGTGGVDDGEDAHVIIHEMAHSFSFNASGHSLVGKERRMMEEGVSDFIAMYYSRKIDPKTDHRIFSWDGHNEYWDGLILNSKQVWDKDQSIGMIEGRQIWASCWNCIAERINLETAFELALESLFYSHKHQKFADMCSRILLIDSLLYSGRHYRSLKDCFINKGFMGGDYRDIPPSNAVNVEVINSEGFARHAEDLWLILPEDLLFEYVIVNAKGEAVTALETGYGRHVKVQNKLHQTGVYFLRLSTKRPNGNHAGTYVFKLMNGL
jgi:hypothetical protein